MIPKTAEAKTPAAKAAGQVEPPALKPDKSFQDLILTLQNYWAAQGCVILQPYDMEVGAGTFHPATTLRALGPEAMAGGLCAAVAAGRPTVAMAKTRTGSSITINSR